VVVGTERRRGDELLGLFEVKDVGEAKAHDAMFVAHQVVFLISRHF